MSAGIRRVVAPLLVIAASVGAYAVLHAAKPAPVKSEQPVRPIKVHTAPVQQGSVTLQVQTQGEVRARTEIDIIAQVGGRVVSVSPEFTEGGRIEPGVSLLVIEDTDYRLTLRQAEARVAESLVRVEQALADADVARKQLRNDPNPSNLALKKPQVAEARARLKAAEADLEQARLDLTRTSITLPFRGRLLDTRVDVGQYVAPGTVIGRAFGTDVVEIRLPLDDSQLASLGLPIGYTAASGQGIGASLSATVAGKPQQWQGQLVRLDASIDPDTRMLYGIAEVVSPYDRNASTSGMPLAVGLFVKVTIAGRELPAALTIPRDALRAGDMVLVINDQNQLEIRPVEVAHGSATQAVISTGLQVGERVIVSPVRNPVRGMALLDIDNTADPLD